MKPRTQTQREADHVMSELRTILPESAKGAKIRATGNCMSGKIGKTLDVYDAFVDILQLALIVAFFFFIRSTTLLPLVKILFASGLSAILLSRRTTKRSLLWWILVVVGTALAASSLIVRDLHN